MEEQIWPQMAEFLVLAATFGQICLSTVPLLPHVPEFGPRPEKNGQIWPFMNPAPAKRQGNKTNAKSFFLFFVRNGWKRRMVSSLARPESVPPLPHQ